MTNIKDPNIDIKYVILVLCSFYLSCPLYNLWHIFYEWSSTGCVMVINLMGADSELVGLENDGERGCDCVLSSIPTRNNPKRLLVANN